MPLHMLCREAQLVLLTAGPPGNDPRIRELLQHDLDWSLVTALAVREKAVPVFWSRLGRVADGELPTAARKRLHPLAMVGSFRQTRLEERFLELMDEIEGRREQVIVLKGAALAVAAYRSFEERPMGDLDLLLHPVGAVDLQRALLENGWEKEFLCVPGKVAPELREAFYQGHHHLAPLVDRARSGVVVEIHTALYPPGHPFRVPASELWRESTVGAYGGRSVRVPSFPHLLLHLCLHFSWSHLMATGAWRTFRDIQALAGVEEVDWGRFPPLADSARGRTSSYWTLRLARSLAGVELPDGVLEALKPPMPEAVLSRLERHLAQEVFPSEVACPSQSVRRKMWSMAIRPGWSGHGRTRPWLASGGNPLAEDPASRSRLQKAWRNLQQIPRWRAYVGTLLSRAGGATAA